MIFNISISILIEQSYNTDMTEENRSSKEIIKEFRQSMLAQYEQNTPLQLYEEEQRLFYCVKNGDLLALNSLLDHLASNKSTPYIGTMSKDPVKQVLFSVVSGITLATRAAMSGGLPDAEAYHLSDAYLQRLDNTLTEQQALELFLSALADFTNRVHNAKIHGAYSLPVTKALKYISSHLHEKPSLVRISEYCGVTPQYLSSVFHKEKGITITAYIRNEKLKVAAQMLEQSNFSIQRISTMLEFPSQSAFTAQFKAYFGKTPYVYRKDFYAEPD